MRLRQGRQAWDVEDLELRKTIAYNGMDTLRFRVPAGTVLNLHRTALLADETGDIPLVVLEYHPDTGQIIAWASPVELPVSVGPTREKRRRR